MQSPVRIALDLAPHEALALAQFLKRVGLEDYRCLAVDVDEAGHALGRRTPARRPCRRRLRAALTRAYRAGQGLGSFTVLNLLICMLF